jgi:aspartate ammonia-lyase
VNPTDNSPIALARLAPAHLELLGALSLFQSLKENEIETFSSYFELEETPKNFQLQTPGEPRCYFRIIVQGQIEIVAQNVATSEVSTAWDERSMLFAAGQFFGEVVLLRSGLVLRTHAFTLVPCVFLKLHRDRFKAFISEHPDMAGKILLAVAHYMHQRITGADAEGLPAPLSVNYSTGKTRQERDLLGELSVPAECYYGVQSLRAKENFHISGISLRTFPVFIKSLAQVKKAAAMANHRIGILTAEKKDAIAAACDEIAAGHWHEHFVVDMLQGGAGTSTNMNANEVIANRALELLGKRRGQYEFLHPNNDVNLSQSTNDAYPTAVRMATLHSIPLLIAPLENLCTTLGKKAREFRDVIKMGRTQLQDAVPMTLGQEFEAFRINLEEDISRFQENRKLFCEVNMGGTAIGTGLNAHPDYTSEVLRALREVTGFSVVGSANLIEATPDTGLFVLFSASLKRLAIKLSKICNDLRLLSSGPRCGFGEINLPPMQPGSSIMPGKVNPVIPEVVNQVAFQVIGNDLTVTMAAEAGQLQLNVMEPVIVLNLFQSLTILTRAIRTLDHKCIRGITANKEVCRRNVENSIGLVTALNPHIGYENSSKIAKEALETGESVFQLVLKHNMLSREQLETILSPENMIGRF